MNSANINQMAITFKRYTDTMEDVFLFTQWREFVNIILTCEILKGEVFKESPPNKGMESQ